MEANELYNFSTSPLVTSSFSLEWSEDNHVSLITYRGVHVFEFVPHPTCVYPTLKFWRSFIYPSDYLPCEVFSKFVEKALWKMKKEEIYKLIMREALTPKISEKTSINPRIIKALWSPVNLATPSKCLLAILTSAGSIEILYKCGSDWISVWNITEQWSDIVKEDTQIVSEEATKQLFENNSWPKYLERFLGTALNWSPLLQDSGGKPFAYLVASFRSSDLIVARIQRIDDPVKMEEPEIVYRHCTKSSARIDQLLWIVLEDGKKHLILIGYADGRIEGLEICERNGILEGEKLFKYEDRPDRIKPSSFKFLNKENGNNIIAVTKSSCLIVLTLDSNGECSNKRYLKLDAFSITGLTTLNNEQLISTTQDSGMYVITIRGNEDLTATNVEHDLKRSRVQYLGITSSPNKAILLNVTSPDGLYDHLINREPSTLQIFALRGEKWNPWVLINEKIGSGVSLREYWDCLELLRIIAAKNNDPEKTLPVISSKNLSNFNIHGLRVTMWLNLFRQIFEKKQISKSVDTKIEETSDARSFIYLLSACDHLGRLSSKSILNNDEKRCASFLRMYLEIYLAGENEEEVDTSEIIKKVSTALRSSSRIDTIETECCNLCNEILTDLPWTVDKCPMGHGLSRCSISLLQITSVDHRSCTICGKLFHPFLDQEYEEVRCLYCDLPALYDKRVRSVRFDESYKKWKNLSKRPIADCDPTESLTSINDMENFTSTNERNKKRSIGNPHTFAVIVNKDRDNDSLITETWQKF